MVTNKIFLYFGVYSGSVKNVDREAKGILFYELGDLERDMEKNPEQFADDLHYILHNYKDDLREFQKRISN